MDNKIVGGTVATTFPVPTKLSDLTDDTGAGIWGVNYAKQSYMSDEAYCDGKGNIITDTYATKKEMESNNEFIDEEFARKHSVPSKLSDLDDDTTDKPIEKAIYAESAYDAMTSSASIYSETSEFALSAKKDEKGNIIHETYATKEEVGNVEIALDTIIAIQKELMGVSE